MSYLLSAKFYFEEEIEVEPNVGPYATLITTFDDNVTTRDIIFSFLTICSQTQIYPCAVIRMVKITTAKIPIFQTQLLNVAVDRYTARLTELVGIF